MCSIYRHLVLLGNHSPGARTFFDILTRLFCLPPHRLCAYNTVIANGTDRLLRPAGGRIWCKKQETGGPSL